MIFRGTNVDELALSRFGPVIGEAAALTGGIELGTLEGVGGGLVRPPKLVDG